MAINIRKAERGVVIEVASDDPAQVEALQRLLVGKGGPNFWVHCTNADVQLSVRELAGDKIQLYGG